jgi:hypothetical protein
MIHSEAENNNEMAESLFCTGVAPTKQHPACRAVRVTMLLFLLGLGLLTPPSIQAQDWPRFRGPDGSGVSTAKNLPIQWSDSEGILWKISLPGPGASSPVTFQDRIYLTAYSGYGVKKGKGTLVDLQYHVLCIKDGKLLWNHEIPADKQIKQYSGRTCTHGYASGSPAVDSEGVYVSFGLDGVFAFDHDGREMWHAALGQPPKKTPHQWGGPSPIIHGNLVVVNASMESGALVALDKR